MMAKVMDKIAIEYTAKLIREPRPWGLSFLDRNYEWDIRLWNPATHAGMEFTFYQRMAPIKPPTLAFMLCTLVQEARYIENASGYTSWAQSQGFDKDDPDAYEAYMECYEQTQELKALLGDDFEQIMAMSEKQIYDACQEVP